MRAACASSSSFAARMASSGSTSLPQRDRVLDTADFLLVGGDRQVRDERVAVVAVHDRKAVLQPDAGRFLAQDLYPQRVERRHRQLLGLPGLLEQLGDAFLHFQRRLVGERERGDRARVVAAVLDHVGDLLRDHARLARAGAGQHEAGAVQVKHGFALRTVQAEIRGGGHGGRLSTGQLCIVAKAALPKKRCVTCR
jgi:hypothetical protein